MRILRLLFILCVVSNYGCFYLVEQGQGGVAERFPLSTNKQDLSERISRCEEELLNFKLQGVYVHNPALYKETSQKLVESRRLYKAEFYQQSQKAIEPVEKILAWLRVQPINETRKLCHISQYQEVCHEITD